MAFYEVALMKANAKYGLTEKIGLGSRGGHNPVGIVYRSIKGASYGASI
jgi:hypothetical protein